jgi:hypothetical protein
VNLINELLQNIHKYYPVGEIFVPQKNEGIESHSEKIEINNNYLANKVIPLGDTFIGSFPADTNFPVEESDIPKKMEGLFHLYSEIMERKVDSLINNEVTPWQNFIEHVNKEISLEVKNVAFHQFPSYTAIIEISKTISDTIIWNRSYHIIVSLLCSGFTCFFLDTYKFHNFEPVHSAPPPFKHIASFQSASLKEDRVLLEPITALVKQYFPEHFFIPHHLLFSYKVELVSNYVIREFSNPILQKFSFFNLLFDPFLENNDLSICH